MHPSTYCWRQAPSGRSRTLDALARMTALRAKRRSEPSRGEAQYSLRRRTFAKFIAPGCFPSEGNVHFPSASVRSWPRRSRRVRLLSCPLPSPPQSETLREPRLGDSGRSREHSGRCKVQRITFTRGHCSCPNAAASMLRSARSSGSQDPPRATKRLAASTMRRPVADAGRVPASGSPTRANCCVFKRATSSTPLVSMWRMEKVQCTTRVGVPFTTSTTTLA